MDTQNMGLSPLSFLRRFIFAIIIIIYIQLNPPNWMPKLRRVAPAREPASTGSDHFGAQTRSAQATVGDLCRLGAVVFQESSATAAEISCADHFR